MIFKQRKPWTKLPGEMQALNKRVCELLPGEQTTQGAANLDDVGKVWLEYFGRFCNILDAYVIYNHIFIYNCTYIYIFLCTHMYILLYTVYRRCIYIYSMRLFCGRMPEWQEPKSSPDASPSFQELLSESIRWLQSKSSKVWQNGNFGNFLFFAGQALKCATMYQMLPDSGVVSIF